MKDVGEPLWTRSSGLHGKARSHSLGRKLNQAKTHLYSHRWAGAGLHLGVVERGKSEYRG
jgi:hypothetical protein